MGGAAYESKGGRGWFPITLVMAVWRQFSATLLLLGWGWLAPAIAEERTLPSLPTGTEFEYSYSSSVQLYGNLTVTLEAKVGEDTQLVLTRVCWNSD